MTDKLQFRSVRLPEEAQALRREVRDFLVRTREEGVYKPGGNSWATFNAAFSRRCGEAGYLGMTWPVEVGGHGRSTLERYVMVEEMLAAGAPVGAHWVADRQSGPQILRHGSPRARREILPGIAAGTCFFAIGMSEPDAGSDLAAVRTRAVRAAGGWRVTGTKIWTTFAHHAHYVIVLARTAPAGDVRQSGLTQFVCDLGKPGVEVRPIVNLAGTHEFNEVILNDYFVEDDFVVGSVGEGWSMVTAELAFERSGPDRFLSAYPLLERAVEHIREGRPDDRAAEAIGGLVARLATLRHMSTSVAGMLQGGENPMLQAAIVKDLGTALEQDTPEVLRPILDVAPSLDDGPLARELAHTILHAPSFSIRGGTREILRGIIARGAGLR
ncbi:alkylation response protein AidB-like acyl-CoA dehydrogenase [Bradyrhizobium sp. CIR48]|uniref:acyl-CoA dehydrogenase family protein n=1 Tax=Bradyrhizobium sp. CIR48 TaxID=2663840 RepID=UPI001808D6B5|nr:acyl-CoA dehydrogenase family protein [Bradyrhizobium sp. CIR48]MBB4423831.1 alkylation response protein AidB-like acyl-CoA dehydrogenase [Bradyrhizobium sp. CIR48]